MFDELSVERIETYLLHQAELHIYPTLSSTNDTAKQLGPCPSGQSCSTCPGRFDPLPLNCCHKTVIIADSQTAGRGRYGRKFFSPLGCGIYMSVVLCPRQLWLEKYSLMTPMAAVAVCEAIEAISSKTPQIKWVNDILLDWRKICGILTELTTNTVGEIDRIIVGIGINFAAPADGFPQEISDIAGSLFGPESPISRNQLIAEILNRLLSVCHPGADSGRMSETDVELNCSKLLKAYKKRLMMLKRRVLVTTPDIVYEATALDVDPSGGLVVQKDCGEITTLTAGEVSLKPIG